jgi:putative transposase
VFGTEVVHCPPRTPTTKPHIERTLGSAASLFAQFVSGYTGRSTEYRGSKVEDEPLWSLPELQELLDQWITSHWQNRRHDALRDPLTPGRTFSPNEKYAALVETAGYLPLALTAEDYLELVPTRWQAVNRYGIKINHRIYNCDDLGPFRREKSGIAAHQDHWEIRHDPYDVRLVWLRDHRENIWITVPWRLLSTAPAPFGELAWDHSARDLRDQGKPATEDAIAEAVSDLLHRAGEGPAESTERTKPGKSGRRRAKVAAQTRAAARPGSPRPQPVPASAAGQEPEDDDDSADYAEVIPLKIFDAHQEARKWW